MSLSPRPQPDRLRGWFAASLLAAFLVAGLSLSLVSSAQDQSEKVENIFNRIEDDRGAHLWQFIGELEGLGQGAIDDIRKGLNRADPYVRTAVGKVLYAREFRQEGLDALAKVMTGKDAAARRVAAGTAVSLVSTDRTLDPAQRRQNADNLKKLVDEQDDDLVKIALWRGVFALTETIEARRKVRDLYQAAKRPEVKDEAALALAEMGAFVWTKAHLRQLADQPTENGRLARAYLKISELSDDIDRISSKASKYDYRLLDEVIDKLKGSYYDAAKVEDTSKLVEAAARGILNSLDLYTAYYDEKAITELRSEGLEGHFGGIGARINMRKDKAGNSWLTIEEPIFSGPAYRAGLRSFDQIRAIEGELTLNQEVNDLVRKIRGKPGTDVKLKVYRTGWTKEKDFVITREEVQLETTSSRILPGDIGYVRYTTFGDLDDEMKNKGTNIEKQVQELETAGMKCLILDLRGNSGGLLRTAQRIASMFLDDGTLVLTTRARGVVKDTITAKGGPATKVPMVVLVDGGSASASEILAGALQDHKRAVLIGEKTFGKGSVQDLKGLESNAEKSAARITIAKWFLPNGRSVEKDNPKDSGVEPDIKVTLPDREFWKEFEFDRLRADGKVMDYVEKAFKDNRDLLTQLAEVDDGDFSRYPEFDALYDSLGTKASKDDVRELVRELVRKKVQDDRGKPFTLDFETDVVLQRGIIESCSIAGLDPKGIKEYGVFAKAPPQTEVK